MTNIFTKTNNIFDKITLTLYLIGEQKIRITKEQFGIFLFHMIFIHYPAVFNEGLAGYAVSILCLPISIIVIKFTTLQLAGQGVKERYVSSNETSNTLTLPAPDNSRGVEDSYDTLYKLLQKEGASKLTSRMIGRCGRAAGLSFKQKDWRKPINVLIGRDLVRESNSKYYLVDKSQKTKIICNQ